MDLIYLDPPFNTKRLYAAPIGSQAAGASFNDMWSWEEDVDPLTLERLVFDYPFLVQFLRSIGGIHGQPMMAYATYMCVRLIELYRILKPTGSLYLHCDPTASHYLKIILDKVFGHNNFRNEIIWSYPASPSAAKKDFPRKHDTLFRYVKTRDFIFNADAVRVEYSEASKKRIQYAANASKVMSGNEIKLQSGGKLPPSVWSDIQQTYRYRKENTGYPTQKPLALLRRIIEASSNVGDVVLDPFCGCATTCVAAEQTGRKWTGIDISDTAGRLVFERLDNMGLLHDGGRPIVIDTTKNSGRDKLPEERYDLEPVNPASSQLRQDLYGKQGGKCNGCGEHFKPQQLEVDHIIPKSKGGGDFRENFQLLCSHCNRVKGDRPMEYLLARIAQIERKTVHSTFFDFN